MQVSGACYETWLACTSAASCSGGLLTLVAPNAFVAEMLEQRLFGIVLETVEKVAGLPLDLRIEVERPSPPSVSDASPTDPGTSKTTGERISTPDAPAPAAARQLARVASRVRFNPAYTFQSFVVGGSNELAHAAAAAVADRPGAVYNPLFVHSDVGLGKTHLLTAIGHNVQSRGLSTVYVTTEEFTNGYIRAIRDGSTEEFRVRYRSADVLLLDDIQFLIGKEQTQEGFFHTFNALHLDGRQIVVTSDRPISELSVLQDRVRSRLSGGLVVDIQPPDLETRLAILQAKARSSGTTVRISDEALELLAGLAHRNVRELEGGLNRAIAYADLTGGEMTAEAVRRVVSTPGPRDSRPPVTKAAVLDAVAAHFSVELRDLSGRRRDARTTLARHIAMYLMRDDARMGLADIGRTLGGRDHSTVLHGRNRVASLARQDDVVRHDLASLRRALSAHGVRS